MTSFVHVDYPVQHPGVARAERTAQWFVGQGNPVIAVLAALGAPVMALARAVAAWRANRLQARDDAAYWNAALSDARIMADISRAMDVHARDTDAYWPSKG